MQTLGGSGVVAAVIHASPMLDTGNTRSDAMYSLRLLSVVAIAGDSLTLPNVSTASEVDERLKKVLLWNGTQAAAAYSPASHPYRSVSQCLIRPVYDTISERGL